MTDQPESHDPAAETPAAPIPVLPLRDVVVYPHMVIPLFVGRPKSIKAMETAMESGKSILLVAQRSAGGELHSPAPHRFLHLSRKACNRCCLVTE